MAEIVAFEEEYVLYWKELVKSLNPRLAFCYWTGVIVTLLHGNVRAPVSLSALVEHG